MLWLANLVLGLGQAQNFQFAYHGKLSHEGQPVSGSFDLRFNLFAASSGGSAIGATLTNTSVPVTGGLFSVLLDGSSWSFDGSPRWLGIAVRSNGTTSGFVELNPRQPIMSAPQSLFASRAGIAQLAEQLRPGSPITGDGAGITNVSGLAILPRSIDDSRMHPLTDAVYRSGASNRISVINVKDFGARGDGVSDDTLAISNAWSAFIKSGGTLYFPAGIYLDSGTHSSTAFVPTEPYFRDGRTIMGLGGAVWIYTGSSRLLYFYNSAPNIENIEFRGNPAAANCIYITSIYGKLRVRNCFFYNWPNTTAGALVIDEADGVALEGATFSYCNIGLGCGYRCSNLNADVLTAACDLGVAVGVPTESFPFIRESQNIELNLMALYGKAGVAIDGGATALNLRAYFWWCTNAVVIGKIPGISTNFSPNVSLGIDHSYWRGSAGLEPPIQLHAPLISALSLNKCRFESTVGSPPIIKSYVASADRVDLRWQESLQTGLPAPVFEDSSGGRLAEVSQFQTRLMNRGLGLYNARNLVNSGGSGYLLDIVDSSYSGPVARLGLNGASNASFDRFKGGLVVSADLPSGTPIVAITNADLVVTPPEVVSTANARGVPGSIRWDSNYVYICVATNLWKRAPLSAW